MTKKDWNIQTTQPPPPRHSFWYGQTQRWHPLRKAASMFISELSTWAGGFAVAQSPSWGFVCLSIGGRRWQLLTLCSQRSRDEVRSSSVSSCFCLLLFLLLSSLMVKNPATERLVTARPPPFFYIYITNPDAFNVSNLTAGGEAFPQQNQNTLHAPCSWHLKTIGKWKWIPVRATGSARTSRSS